MSPEDRPVKGSDSPLKPVSDAQLRNEQFFRTLQKGDLDLNSMIASCISIFGFSRIGKTTLGHLLSGNRLVPYESKSELSWKVDQSTDRYKSALVSDSKDSVTWIPNVFQTSMPLKGLEKRRKEKEKDEPTEKIKIVDQPGFGDTGGFYNILSNGYFHYRTFSKIKSMRFVVVVDYDQLKGTGNKFVESINQFQRLFKDYLSLRDNIEEASCIVVTKVNPDIQQQNLIQSIKALTKKSSFTGPPQDIENFKTFASAMMKGEKIYPFYRPSKMGMPMTQNCGNNLLKEIIKTTPYERVEVKASNLFAENVQMSSIRFGVSTEVLQKLSSTHKQNQSFRTDFMDFMSYSKNKIEEYLTVGESSINNVLLAICDSICTSKNEELKFIELMRIFNQKQDRLFCCEEIQNKSRSLIADKYLSLKSQSLSHFQSLSQSQSLNQRHNQSNKPLSIPKKFFVFKDIMKICNDNSKYTIVTVQRSAKTLELTSNMFINLFQLILKLRNRSEKWQEEKKIINKYHYHMQRLISEQKVFTQVLYGDETIKKQLAQYHGCDVDIFGKIRNQVFISTLEKAKEVSEDMFAMLNSNQITDQIEVINILEERSASRDTTLLICSIAVKIAKKEFNKAGKERDPSALLPPVNENSLEASFNLKECLLVLVKYYEKLQSQIENEAIINDQEYIKKAKHHFFSITTAIGRLLCSRFQNAQAVAIEFFKSISNVHMVLQLYEQLLETLKDRRVTLLEMGKYASSVCRSELAMKCYQQAYNLIDSEEELDEVSTLTLEEGIKTIYTTSDYLRRVNNREVIFVQPSILLQLKEMIKLSK